MELSLKNREWKEFELGELFSIKRGKRLIASNRKKGNLPYFSAAASNNGLTDFIKNPLFVEKDKIIVTTFCDAYYVKGSFTASDEITMMSNKSINEYSGKFVTKIIVSNQSKYAFGRKAFSERLEKQKILLPINSKGNPDYEFMENYIRAKEQEKTNAYKNYISKRISELENTKEVVSLSEKEWEEFFIEDIFTTKIGKNVDGNKVDKTKGKFAYITRKESNNGLDGFISFDKKILNKDYPVITIGNETAEPFVQEYPFFTGTKVNILKPKISLTRFSLSFISMCLKMHKSKYSYSFTINSTRLKRQKIMLPINDNHEPDYEYMENYMKQLELRKLKKYLEFKNITT